MVNTISKTTENYKCLWILIFAYVFITISSDLYESKLIDLYGLHAGAGIILFSFTFFLIEVITEVYGYKKARLAIWLGICFSIFFVIYVTFIALINDFVVDNTVSYIIYQTKKVYVSTIITIFVAEHINAYIVSKLKVMFEGKYIGIRFVFSTFVSTGVSMSIFTTAAFLGTMPFFDFVVFTVSSWLYRFFTELMLVPASVKLAVFLKSKEKVDVFDFDTNYNVLSIETDYQMDSKIGVHDE